MTMILVARSHKARKSADDAVVCPRARRRVIVFTAAAMLGCTALGIAFTLVFAGPRDHALGQIADLHAQVTSQKTQLEQVRQSAQRDMDAMTVKLGELQAQSIRLDALGQRLTEVGKLDQGEFDFQHAPALGGPEQSVAPAAALPPNLDASLDALRVRFDHQQTQLGVLSDLLMNRQVDARDKPTGMPVADGYIASYFGARPDPFNGHRDFHPGLDIDVPMGSPVHAVADGVITYAGARSGYGNVVEIDHGNGYMTRYAHNSKLLAHVGEHVHAGDVISDVGSTGRSTGPHVHFEVWDHGRVVNPLAFVRSRRAVF
ncbi:MAG: peptidoglycan DD-metalloendopeptidase family protein [Pseudomonadota bacterium]|nr:peptidoglycan DD-metalloendopeptidase family protein [Pseudomonadota bacterium]